MTAAEDRAAVPVNPAPDEMRFQRGDRATEVEQALGARPFGTFVFHAKLAAEYFVAKRDFTRGSDFRAMFGEQRLHTLIEKAGEFPAHIGGGQTSHALRNVRENAACEASEFAVDQHGALCCDGEFNGQARGGDGAGSYRVKRK